MWDDLAKRASRAVGSALSIGADDDAGLLSTAAGPSSLRAASASAAAAAAAAAPGLRTRSRTNLAAMASKLGGGDSGGGGHYAYGELADADAKAAGGSGGGGLTGEGIGGGAAADGNNDNDDANGALRDGGGGPPPPHPSVLVDRALAKTTRRLMPVVLLVVGLNYLDRTALSFAGISLSADLGLTPSDFGFASGAFFLGYSVFQLPSNLVAMRLGARRWLPFLMVCWGAAAASFAALRTPAQLAWLRLALGAAESGAFPCIWYALSLFYPRDKLTRPYATMLVAVAVSQVVAAPLAAAMLSLDGLWGLRGWQIVFLAEGVPAILLGLALPWLLPDGPADAPFLTGAEREALKVAVDRAAAAGDALMTAGSGPAPPLPGEGEGEGEGEDEEGRRMPPVGSVVSPPARRVSSSPPAASEPPPLSSSSSLLPTRAPPHPHHHHHKQQQQHHHHKPPPLSSPPPARGTLALIAATAARPEVWVLAAANILKDMAAFAALFFCPLIVASLIKAGGGGGAGAGAGGAAPASPSPAAAAPSASPHHGPAAAPPATGVLPVLLTAIPFGAAAAGTYAWSGRAQERGDPAWHAAAPFALGGALFALFPLANFLRSPALAMAALTAGLVGAFCGGPLIVVLVTAAAPPEATAVALPLFNSVGMIGGFLGPVLLGWIVDRSGGSYGAGAATMGASLCGAGAVLWSLRAWKLRKAAAAAAAAGGGSLGVEFAPLKPQRSAAGGIGGSGGGGGG